MPASRSQEVGPDIGQAPGDLGTLQAFVNTLDIEQETDALGSPAELDAWLRAAGLVGDYGDPAGQRDLDLAVELREALRGVLRSHVTRPNSTGRGSQAAEPDAFGPGDGKAAGTGRAAAARVADVAAAMRTGIKVDADGLIVIVPAGPGATAALTRLLLIGAEAATAGTWTRLKVCSADDCQWAFYDRSPTHSGCWCSMQICGSRAKSRAYRSRLTRTGD